MDWLQGPDIEVIPGKMGGLPVVKGTRVEPDTIVMDFELGSPVEEIHENFPTVPVAAICRLIAFAPALACGVKRVLEIKVSVGFRPFTVLRVDR